ncbi:hypothetical protein [Nocardia sp. IFM 10818]
MNASTMRVVLPFVFVPLSLLAAAFLGLAAGVLLGVYAPDSVPVPH